MKKITWKEASFGFPRMTAQGQEPGFDSVPPTIRVCSKNPHGVRSGAGVVGEGVVVMTGGGPGGGVVVGVGALRLNFFNENSIRSTRMRLKIVFSRIITHLFYVTI
jgi:hypothetical protein